METEMTVFPGLTDTDNLVLKLACERAIEVGSSMVVEAQSILTHTDALSISQADVFESLEILASRRYIKIVSGVRSEIEYFSISTSAFERYARMYVSDYDNLVNSLSVLVVENEMTNNKVLASRLGKPQMIVNHILTFLANQQLLDVTETMGTTPCPEIDVYHVSAALKRKVRK